MTIEQLLRRLSKFPRSVTVRVGEPGGDVWEELEVVVDEDGNPLLRLQKPGILGIAATEIPPDNSHETPAKAAPSKTMPVTSPPSGIEACCFLTASEQVEIGDYLKGRKPLRVEGPDGFTVLVSEWKHVCEVVVKYLLTRHEKLPVPFRVNNARSRLLLNSEAVDANGKPFGRNSAVEIQDEKQTFYIDTKRDAGDTIRSLTSLVLEVGDDPASFFVVTKPMTKIPGS
jgi:hypothetical protein